MDLDTRSVSLKTNPQLPVTIGNKYRFHEKTVTDYVTGNISNITSITNIWLPVTVTGNIGNTHYI